MGSDVLSVCVFCASLLLRQDFDPSPRFSSELTIGYSTFSRRELRDTGTNEADVTAHIVAAAFRWTRPPAEGLGAGTPASEAAFQGGFPGAHTETAEDAAGASGDGNGRLEDYALLGRRQLTGTGSLEVAGQQRRLVLTDLLSAAGGERARGLDAERYDLALGWRQRFRGVELAAHGAYVDVYGKHETRGSRIAINGNLLGGGADLRVRRGPWTLAAFGEYASGPLTGARRLAEDAPFERVDRHAWIAAQGLSLHRAFGPTEVQLAGTLDQWHLPFVAFAVLGSETRAFEAGALPDVRADLWTAGLSLRHRFSERLAARAFARASGGSESVRLRGPGSSIRDEDVRIGFSHSRRAFLLMGTVELRLGR